MEPDPGSMWRRNKSEVYDRAKSWPMGNSCKHRMCKIPSVGFSFHRYWYTLGIFSNTVIRLYVILLFSFLMGIMPNRPWNLSDGIPTCAGYSL